MLWSKFAAPVKRVRMVTVIMIPQLKVVRMQAKCSRSLCEHMHEFLVWSYQKWDTYKCWTEPRYRCEYTRYCVQWLGSVTLLAILKGKKHIACPCRKSNCGSLVITPSPSHCTDWGNPVPVGTPYPSDRPTCLTLYHLGNLLGQPTLLRMDTIIIIIIIVIIMG